MRRHLVGNHQLVDIVVGAVTTQDGGPGSQSSRMMNLDLDEIVILPIQEVELPRSQTTMTVLCELHLPT